MTAPGNRPALMTHRVEVVQGALFFLSTVSGLTSQRTTTDRAALRSAASARQTRQRRGRRLGNWKSFGESARTDSPAIVLLSCRDGIAHHTHGRGGRVEVYTAAAEFVKFSQYSTRAARQTCGAALMRSAHFFFFSSCGRN